MKRLFLAIALSLIVSTTHAATANTIYNRTLESNPATGDELLIEKAGDGPSRKITIGSIISGQTEVTAAPEDHIAIIDATDSTLKKALISTIVGATDAYSSMWFHGDLTEVTISTQNAFTKTIIFVNVGDEDADGNVVGDATTDDDFTINLAGTYIFNVQASFNNDGGGSAEFQIAPKIILNTAKTITDATNATPIVITSAVHGLLSGDGVIQSGVVGNTAANGDFYILRLSANTYSLETLAHVDVVGNGAYTSGGTVTAVIPGNIIMERIISNTDLGRGAARGTYILAVGDVVEAVVVNEDGTANLRIEQIQFGIRRM